MVEKNQRRLLPVNYRRAVNSPEWPMIAFLSVKLGKRPNEIIDQLILLAYKEIKENEQLQRDSGE